MSLPLSSLRQELSQTRTTQIAGLISQIVLGIPCCLSDTVIAGGLSYPLTFSWVSGDLNSGLLQQAIQPPSWS